MKFFRCALSAVFIATGLAVAQDASAAVTTTITASPGCPSAAPADVMVTRSAVVVPSCNSSNETKPTIVTMPGYGMNATATQSGDLSQFTGGAVKNGLSGLAAVVGCGVVALMV